MPDDERWLLGEIVATGIVDGDRGEFTIVASPYRIERLVDAVIYDVGSQTPEQKGGPS